MSNAVSSKATSSSGRAVDSAELPDSRKRSRKSTSRVRENAEEPRRPANKTRPDKKKRRKPKSSLRRKTILENTHSTHIANLRGKYGSLLSPFEFSVMSMSSRIAFNAVQRIVRETSSTGNRRKTIDVDSFKILPKDMKGVVTSLVLGDSPPTRLTGEKSSKHKHKEETEEDLRRQQNGDMVRAVASSSDPDTQLRVLNEQMEKRQKEREESSDDDEFGESSSESEERDTTTKRRSRRVFRKPVGFNVVKSGEELETLVHQANDDRAHLLNWALWRCNYVTSTPLSEVFEGKDIPVPYDSHEKAASEYLYRLGPKLLSGHRTIQATTRKIWSVLESTHEQKYFHDSEIEFRDTSTPPVRRYLGRNAKENREKAEDEHGVPAQKGNVWLFIIPRDKRHQIISQEVPKESQKIICLMHFLTNMTSRIDRVIRKDRQIRACSIQRSCSRVWRNIRWCIGLLRGGSDEVWKQACPSFNEIHELVDKAASVIEEVEALHVENEAQRRLDAQGTRKLTQEPRKTKPGSSHAKTPYLIERMREETDEEEREEDGSDGASLENELGEHITSTQLLNMSRQKVSDLHRATSASTTGEEGESENGYEHLLLDEEEDR